MRDYRGVVYAGVKDLYTREAISTIDEFLRDVAAGMGRITRGQMPNSSGDPLSPPLDDYFYLLGRFTPQVAYFGTQSGASTGKLSSTTHATKGKILLGASSAFDEANTLLGIGTASPSAVGHFVGNPQPASSTPVPTGAITYDPEWDNGSASPPTAALVTDGSDATFWGLSQVDIETTQLSCSVSPSATASAVTLNMRARRTGGTPAGNTFTLTYYDAAGTGWSVTFPTTDVATSFTNYNITLTQGGSGTPNTLVFAVTVATALGTNFRFAEVSLIVTSSSGTVSAVEVIERTASTTLPYTKWLNESDAVVAQMDYLGQLNTRGLVLTDPDGGSNKITHLAPTTLAVDYTVTWPTTALAVGDLLYADTTSSLAKLADVSVGSYLRSGGVSTAPLWSTLKLPNAAAIGTVLWASSADNIAALTAPTAPGQVLRANSTSVIAWGAVDMADTDAVTGVLAVANGGTGAATFTDNGVLFGNLTAAIGATAEGATGQVLIGNTGAPPSWGTITGMTITLGTPTDGALNSPGAASLTTSTKVTDAIDTIDELLSYLVPADALTLDGTTLTAAGTSKFSGYLSQGNTNYKGADPAGTLVNYIITDVAYTLSTPSTSTTFNKADEGYTRWYKAVGSAAYSGTPEDEVNHSALFQESERAGTQTTTPWTDAQLSVTSVTWYNSFPSRQKGNAVLTLTSGQHSQGYNRFKITREGSFTTQTSTDYEVFYDNDAGANPSVSTPTVAEATPAFTYRSGVKHYGLTSTFNVSCVGSDCFDNTYVLNPIALSGTTAAWFTAVSIPWNDATVSGVTSPPTIGNTMTVTNKVITIAAGQFQTNARVRATPSDPFGSYTVADSASENRLTLGYANDSSGPSTDTVEGFDDEHYRMLSNFNMDSVSYSSGGAGGWDSTISLISGTAGYDGLQVYNSSFLYPVTNFSSGYLPTGQPNYTTASGIRSYIRYFYVGTGKQNFTWTLSGATTTPVSVATGPSGNNVTFEMLGPATTKNSGGTTEFKDMFVAYTTDAAIGCYVSGTRAVPTSTWVTTLGTKSTATSGNVVVVRIKAASGWTGNINTLSVVAA